MCTCVCDCGVCVCVCVCVCEENFADDDLSDTVQLINNKLASCGTSLRCRFDTIIGWVILNIEGGETNVCHDEQTFLLTCTAHTSNKLKTSSAERHLMKVKIYYNHL